MLKDVEGLSQGSLCLQGDDQVVGAGEGPHLASRCEENLHDVARNRQHVS